MRCKLLQAGRTRESQVGDKFVVTPSPVLDDSTDESTRVELTRLPEVTTSATPTSIPTPTTIVSQEKSTSPEITEENYVPMTPRKSVLDPLFVEKVDPEENAYMEMSRGHGAVALLDPKRSPVPSPDLHSYEIFSFAEGKIEPVYMEVSGSETQTPTVINNPEPEKTEAPPVEPDKSDSSDADDEASKDLDSLDAPFHPRFSLSDTFRPASYYLGASQVFTEFHDSSDSELVSPPPIPTSPQLTDLDLDSFRHQNDYYTLLNISDPDTVSNNDTSNPAPLGYLSADNLKQVHDSPFAPSFQSDSDIEIRHSSYYERMLKRRPVSDEFYDELESLDSTLKTPEISYLKEQDPPNLPKIDYGSNMETSSDMTLGLCSSPVSTDESPLGGERNRVPYYCSDLMNNQRQAVPEGKKDIMRIVNPIRTKTDNTYKLAAEARSVSVDFLNLADKPGQIDKKNLYESDTLKRAKASEATRDVPEKDDEKGAVRRTHSLAGLLDDETKPDQPPVDESARVWEEDVLWRDRLRVVSQRHTRSLDGLDDIGEPEKPRHKRKLTRDVTYVNDNVIHRPHPTDNPKPANYLIDRETLRQWDLLSSAPSDSGATVTTLDTQKQVGGDNKELRVKPEPQETSGICIYIFVFCVRVRA